MKRVRKTLCLDWDRQNVRIVLARIGKGDLKIEDAHSHRIPTKVAVDDAAALGAYIKELMQRHRIGLRQACVDIPRDRAVINRLTVPPTPLNDVAAAVRFQAMRELPFPVDTAAIDFVVTKQNDEGLATEVLLAAVKLDALQQTKDVLLAAGLTAERIGLRPLSNMGSVLKLPALDDQRVLLLDVSPGATEINIIHEQMLCFSRSASVSVPQHGDEPVDDDSRISSKSEMSAVLLEDDADANAVHDLVVETTRTLQGFRAQEPGDSTLDQIIIAGNTGIEPALVEALEERFKTPTTVFDPTPALGVAQNEANKLCSFSAVLGLAWALHDHDELPLDFINPKRTVPRSEIIAKRVRVVSIAAVTMVVAVVGATVWYFRDLHQQFVEIDTQNDALVKQVRENVEIDIRAREARIWAEEAERGIWLDHLLTIANTAIDPGKKMVLSDLDFNVDTGRMRATLLCSEWEVATAFVKALNATTDADGEPLYRAEQGPWQEVKTIDERFAGTVRVTVEIIALADRSTVKERESDYRKMRRVP